MDRFTHLHLHTEFSILDGLGTVKEYVKTGAELGQAFMAITDHGHMCGAPEFYHECRKAGIEPIIGEEFYVVDDVSWRPARGEGQPERYHLVVLARGEQGYRVLSELSTEAHRHYYYKPVLDLSLLENLGADAQHLVVLSGCAGSMLSKAITGDDRQRQRFLTQWYRETFPHFFLELQSHGTDFDQKINKGLLRLSERYSVPWLMTNDPHYVVPEDNCHHDTLLAIQTASDIDDPARFRFDGHGYHLRTRKEMRRAFRDMPLEQFRQGADRTLEVAALCAGRIPSWETRTWQIPSYPLVPEGSTAYRHLRSKALRELRRRGWDQRPEYVEQTKLELKVFKEVGISDFLLITMEAIEWAKQEGIRVGPGRGSVCGSLVAQLIGLHKIDPIKYKLLFERFLNPARPRMPDIDTDFSQRLRYRMFEHTEEMYGRENVVNVCAYGRMMTRKAFQQLARAYGVGHAEAIEISKKFPKDDEEAAIDFIPEDITTRFPELADELRRLSGTKSSISKHPAGVIIANPDVELRKQVPEMWIPQQGGGHWIGQYDLNAVEELGLMKQDFLGLRTLDTIEETIALIKEFRGEDVEPDDWVPDDEDGDDEVYAMLARGETLGVFQMEGPTNQRGIQAIKCQNFEDIVSCTSLYRTGAISAGFPAIFLANREAGQRHIPYAHPKLKPILGDTWGVVLYQEQVMEIGRSLAGFDMVQVDDIKEAIKHKKSDLMKSMKPLFVRGCRIHSGIDKDTALKIWKMIEGYSGYGYNRSHAVAYSMTTYQTARLKCLYYIEFLCGLLRTIDTSTPEGKERRETYLREAVGKGVTVLVPDINLSDAGARPTGAGAEIRLGLADYRGIGLKAAQKALEGRPAEGYESVAQVEAAVRNKGSMEIFAKGGALDCLGVQSRLEDHEELLSWQFHDSMVEYREQYRGEVLLPGDGQENEDHVVIVGEIFKITKAMAKTGKPYVTWKVRWSTAKSYDIRLWAETERHWNLKVGSVVMVAGKWEGRWQNISCGDPRAIRVIKRSR